MKNSGLIWLKFSSFIIFQTSLIDVYIFIIEQNFVKMLLMPWFELSQNVAFSMWFFFQIFKCIHCFHIKVINKVLLVLKLLYFIFISKFCFPACVFQLLPQKTLRKKKLFHMKMHSLKMKDMFLHLPEISTGQFLNFIHYYRFSFLCKVFQ